MAKQKDPLDEIASELVVFQHEDKNRADRYVSNDPRWNDSRIRERWLELYSDDAIAEDDSDEDEAEDPGYGEWKNDDLRTELLKRGLSVDGTKAEMADRLYEDDEKDD